MQVTKNITLDLLETGSPVIIKAKQNDRNTRYIAAHLYVDGLTYPVPSGTEIAFRYKKPDGTAGFYDALPDNSPAITVSGNTVTVELVEQVLTAAGCVHCEINMYNAASEKLTTFTFEISVEESVLTDAEITSSDYYNVLTAEIAKALQAVTDATEQAENAAQSAQEAADSAAMSKDWAAGQPVTYNGTPVSIAYAGTNRIASITAYGENAQGGTTEAPVALTGVDSVHVCGRNLLPLPYSQVSETKNGLNIAVNADGTITVSGTATAETYLNLKPIPASLYRLMGVTGIVPAYDYPVTKNGFTFFDLTIQPHVEFALVYIVITKGSVVNRTYRPYIIKSAEPLPYETYQGSVTPIPIPRPLRRVGDVKDKCVTRQKHEGAEKLVVTYNVGYIASYAGESITTAWISSTGALSTGAEVAYVLSSPEVYATDPLDIDNAAGPLTVLTGGAVEVRMTELVGSRSPELAGKMDKATYDADGDGVVDKAAAVPWDGVTGKPGTFTPSTHTHDDRYYTETEMNTKLAGKANSSHTHGVADISGVLPATKGGTGANKSVLAISSAIVTTASQGYANVNISTNATICAVVSQGSATGQCYSISVIDPKTGGFSIQVKDYNGNVVANKTLRVNYIAYSI